MPHPGLQPIGAGAGQHFVNAQHVERVQPDPEMKGVLAARGGHLLSHGDADGLQRFGRDLLFGHRDEHEALGEEVGGRLFVPDVVDADFGVGHSAVEARFGVRLILLVAVAAGRACKAFVKRNGNVFPSRCYNLGFAWLLKLN